MVRPRSGAAQLNRGALGGNASGARSVHPAIKTFLAGATIVVVFDTLGALASQQLGFRYSILSIGSYLIYLAITYRSGKQAGVFVATIAGAGIGLIDSTLGWALSWSIGPGRPPQPMSGTEIVGAIVFVTLFGAALGLVGGAVGRTIGKRVAA